MEFAWKSFSDPAPDADLRGVVGHLQPVGYRGVPKVLWLTRKIETQLAESAGLVGYALRAKPAQKKFWAVAAWKSDEELQHFVESDPHAGIRMALKPDLNESWFKRFDLLGIEVPLGIDEGLDRV